MYDLLLIINCGIIKKRNNKKNRLQFSLYSKWQKYSALLLIGNILIFMKCFYSIIYFGKKAKNE